MTLLPVRQFLRCASTIGHRSLSTVATNSIIDPSYNLTSSQKQLQSTAYSFALNEFRPLMKEWDEKEIFPREQLRKCAELGFGGLYISVDDGGSGLSRLETSVVIEALAQGCVSTTALLSIHNMCASMLSRYGSDELKSRLLPDLISFKLMASYCLTEPESGSDSSSLLTSAARDGDHYKLNGTKSFISGGGESDVYFIMCRTGQPGPKGISCILVEKDTPGLSFGKKEQKLGWNSQPTRAVIMEECRVPATNLLGTEGQGFNYAMEGINGGRLNISACSLGAAQRALEETIQYTMERKQFKQSLYDFQNINFRIARMASELLSYRLLVRAAAQRMDEDSAEGDESDIDNRHMPTPAMVAASKLLATEGAYQIIDQCLQMHGGYGYLKDFAVQQLLRDSRVHRILEGTNEVMQLIIARSFQSR